MKLYKFCTVISSVLVFSALTFFSGCSSHEDTVSCFPQQQISAVLYLNNPSYFPLQTNGWTYIDEQQSGTRGLILVKSGNNFKVYDRNAPHICPDNNTTLSVKDNIKIFCPQDGAEWNLLTGEPVKIANLPPKTYRYSYDAANNVLTVYN